MEMRLSGSDLLHALMALRIKQSLEYSELQETGLNELTCQ